MQKKYILAAALILSAPEIIYCAAHLAEKIPAQNGSCSVLVLGSPPKEDGSPSAVDRYRVESGLKAFYSQNCALMVISGGTPYSDRAEAEVMGELAIQEGMSPSALILEEKAKDTWENIQLSMPYLKNSQRIFLVSDSLHALRAKRYFCKQKPDLCARAYPYSDYRPFQLYLSKWVEGSGEIFKWFRDRVEY